MAGRLDRARGEGDGCAPDGALAHGGSRKLRCADIAAGAYRSPDPTYRLRGHVLVRRLSPNDFKIETKQKDESGKKAKAKEQENPKAVERPELINAAVLHAMGRDLAAIHRATDAKGKIAASLKRKKEDWLFVAVGKATAVVSADFNEWKAHHDQDG